MVEECIHITLVTHNFNISQLLLSYENNPLARNSHRRAIISEQIIILPFVGKFIKNKNALKMWETLPTRATDIQKDMISSEVYSAIINFIRIPIEQ